MVLCISFSTAFAQSPANTLSVPTSDSRQIYVDIVVTDRDNHPVEGLSQKDFELFDDGKPQQILSFAVHKEDVKSSAENNDSTINVVLLDERNTAIADQEQARFELIQYFQHKPPSSRFVIFVVRPRLDVLSTSFRTLQLVQEVTADSDALIKALDQPVALPTAPLPVSLKTGGEDRTMPAFVDLGEFLKDFPGRKNLIWLAGRFDSAPVAQYSDRLFVPKFEGWLKADASSRTDILHLAADRLARDRVAIYPVDITGKNQHVTEHHKCIIYGYGIDGGGYSPDIEYECDERGPKLQFIADQSGGSPSHGPDKIQEGIGQAVADGANYYTLTYLPVIQKLNGNVRKIKLKIDDKDYKIAYRRSYFADDPSALYRPQNLAAQDLLMPIRRGFQPFTLMRVAVPVGPESQDPLLPVMQRGGRQSQEVSFTVHVDASDKPALATKEQMDKLQDYSAFQEERVYKAMFSPNKRGKTVLSLTKSQKKALRKKGLSLNSLPPPNPVTLQRYTIEYSIAPGQLAIAPSKDGKVTANLEVAVLAYDKYGQRLAGFKDAITLTDDTDQFRQSEYRTRQTIDVPISVDSLRLAVRDVNSGKTGSLEKPVSEIYSPYARKLLQLPTEYPPIIKKKKK